jgi:rhomboid protease GluP
VLLPVIAQRLGAGLGVLLVLIAGAVGNLLAALAHAPDHAAVGASTATFGAIGILGALRSFPGPEVQRRWRSWTVPAACLVLLTLLGAGRGADVLAHITGFLSGAFVGLAVAAIRRPFGPAVQWTCGGMTIALIAGCWLRALS